MDEASRLERHAEHPLEAEYRALARDAVESPRLVASIEATAAVQC